MNEFPAVRVLLAAACLDAAGLAMPAQAGPEPPFSPRTVAK